MPLFDELDRTDATPAAHGEDSFGFLNRAAGERWARVRSLVEAWWQEFPVQHQPDVRGRYRSKRPGSHLGAWWELYLHRLLRRLTYDVQIHPSVSGTDKRPDFRIEKRGKALYVEGAVVFSGIVDKGRSGVREGWILDALNRGTSDSFFIGIEFEQVGTERPSDREIFEPVESWLASLDPDDVEAQYEVSGDHPSKSFDFRDWLIRVQAVPVGRDARGPNPERRLVGYGPVFAGFIDDRSQIRDTAKRKASRYGTLDAPLLLAINCATSFPKDEDFGDALFGSIAYEYEIGVAASGRPVRRRDGVWMEDRGPASQRLSGVLAAAQMHPWTVDTVKPTLWRNPWADRPLCLDWPVSEGSASSDGFIEFQPRDPDMARILGL